MRDWLGPEIERELGLAVQWKRRACAKGTEVATLKDAPVEQYTVNDRLDPRKFKNIYGDDGSNLTVKVESAHGEGRVVQLYTVRLASSQPVAVAGSQRDESAFCL